MHLTNLSHELGDWSLLRSIFRGGSGREIGLLEGFRWLISWDGTWFDELDCFVEGVRCNKLFDGGVASQTLLKHSRLFDRVGVQGFGVSFRYLLNKVDRVSLYGQFFFLIGSWFLSVHELSSSKGWGMAIVIVILELNTGTLVGIHITGLELYALGNIEEHFSRRC